MSPAVPPSEAPRAPRPGTQWIAPARPTPPARPAHPTRTALTAARRRERLRRRRRRLVLVALAAVVLGAGAAALTIASGPSVPPGPKLTPLQASIVRLAESQLGVRSDPSHSYCNRYSAYWDAGSSLGCAPGLLAEEWCADFAAWVWRRAGVPFVYGTAPGDLNGDAISFYTYGLAHGTWHRAGSHYVPKPGDVAVYGLDAATGYAQHVAVVSSYLKGERGPDVVNGDGSRTAFSIVERGVDQWKADVHDDGGLLAGYVSPFVPARATPRGADAR